MKIIRQHLIFLIFLFLQYCSTIEFIPDIDYDNLNKSEKEAGKEIKSNFLQWEEIEIVFSKPKRPYKIYGTILIREYQKLSNYEDLNKLKKELFNLGFDGIWLTQQNKNQIPPTLIQGQNAQGITVSVYEANHEIYILKGYPYRYKYDPKK